jgi:hypothetical protein
VDDNDLTNVNGNVLHPLVRPFWEIALFRAGPQDLPDSRPLLVITISASILLGLPIWLLAFLYETTEPGWRLIAGIAGDVLLNAALQFLFVLLMLKYFGFTSRLQQTTIAVFGTDALLTVLLTPPFVLVSLGNLHPESTGLLMASLLAFLLVIVIMLWSLAVYAHIFSLAISRTFGFGVVLAMLNFIILLQLGR